MIRHKFTVAALLVLISMVIPMQAQSVTVIIKEATVNDLMSAIGPVSGKGKGAKSIRYTWTVTSPAVDFSPGTTGFQANVKVKVKGITLSDKVKGRMQVDYDPATNKITMKVVEAKFPISIKLLGKKIKVATLDIAKYYQPKFEFNGPEPVQKQISMDVGNGITRTIDVTATGHTVKPVQDALEVSVNLAYVGK